MVVASTLAFLAVNDKLDKDGQGTRKGELVEMAVENEKRVGVNSGGMDQAASVISLPTSALYISFFPVLHAESILLPITRTVPRAVFVCANSLVVSDKVVGAKTRYNLRVVEVLVAARILARLLSLSFISGAPASKPTLREILGAYINARIRIPGSEVLETNEVRGQASPALSVEQLEEGLGRLLGECEVLRASKLVGRVGGEEGLTMEEMVEASGLSKEVFEEVYLSWVDVEATHFQLYKRAKHVFSEALRVLQFRKLCLSVSGSSEEGDLPESTLKDLGALMDASQESCSELFECSCPELNRLTTIAREAGAYGSRLTGAGWGGCTVSLVAENDVEGFISRVKAAYPPYRDLEGERLSEVIFATKPSGGAFGTAIS
ncbi:hypothetical protein PHLCEN_2v7080 [Hermanssonia centrifuga]|uniref:GHMP kinase C-terminal domain-containing protein n=1 Tax=Hermanssonia centrifuga TaxID=98765 RepID=A0A2R6NXJ8_9APHY|nr:hypothetical protein PHLCEN_2v7080 [Hermanssonia centrifuga]